MKDMMHYKGYYGSVHFDEDALIFHGKVEFVRTLISYEATNAKELKLAFEEAVNDYFALCKTQKIKPEQPFKGSLNIRLGPILHRKVAIFAIQNQMTLNKFITDALLNTIEQKQHVT